MKTSLISVEVVPRIFMHMETFVRMHMLVEDNHKEIMLLGTVEKENNNYMIKELYFPPQSLNSAAYVETDDDRYPQWIMSIPEETRTKLRMHMHTHPKMNPTPSPTDETSLSNIIADLDDFYIRIIANQKAEYRIDLYHIAHNIAYKELELEVTARTTINEAQNSPVITFNTNSFLFYADDENYTEIKNKLKTAIKHTSTTTVTPNDTYKNRITTESDYQPPFCPYIYFFRRMGLYKQLDDLQSAFENNIILDILEADTAVIEDYTGGTLADHIGWALLDDKELVQEVINNMSVERAEEIIDDIFSIKDEKLKGLEQIGRRMIATTQFLISYAQESDDISIMQIVQEHTVLFFLFKYAKFQKYLLNSHYYTKNNVMKDPTLIFKPLAVNGVNLISEKNPMATFEKNLNTYLKEQKT